MNRHLGLLLSIVGFASGVLHAAGEDAAPWRTDYNSARREAQEKGLPLVVVVGSPECIYCRKMDATTYRDAGLIAALQSGAVLVKVDGSKEPIFVQALKIQIYPTTMIAGPDGTVHAFLQGFQTPEQVRKSLLEVTAKAVGPSWLIRDLADAARAVSLGDYPQAVVIYRGILSDAGSAPFRVKAQDALAKIEAESAAKLARGKQLEAGANLPAAVDAYADVVRTYTGTLAAKEAVDRLMLLASRGENAARLRSFTARELSAVAKEELRRERFADSLDRYDDIAAQFPDLPDGKSAGAQAAALRADPVKLNAVADQLSARAAGHYLALAEHWKLQGDEAKATLGFERVIQLAPGSRSADVAGTQLAAYRRGQVPAATTGRGKAP